MNYLDRDLFRDQLADAPNIEPFLKWAGGKRWLFRRHRDLFPKKIEKMIDPFIGGGSSFFYLKPQTAILADLNSDLIELYAAVRDFPRTLTRSLIHYQRHHCKRFFYRVRSRKPGASIRRAAWLLYLNRTCWNGLFRVNLRGEFNVPIGTKTKIFSSINELDSASEMLRSATLLSSDFEKIIDCARKGDLVFADPPYFEKGRNVRFLKYNSAVFSWEDQLRLRDALIRASKRGALCFVTNANQNSLLNLYRDNGRIHKLTRHSILSGNNSGRGEDREILVEMK